MFDKSTVNSGIVKLLQKVCLKRLQFREKHDNLGKRINAMHMQITDMSKIDLTTIFLALNYPFRAQHRTWNDFPSHHWTSCSDYYSIGACCRYPRSFAHCSEDFKPYPAKVSTVIERSALKRSDNTNVHVAL